MTKTDTRDVKATVSQIHELEAAGCEIVRVAVPDEKAAKALRTVKKEISIPLIADIHFRYDLALKALEQGVDGLRINPGNIGGAKKVEAVVACARERGVPIRIGINSGSLEKGLLKKHGGPTPEALVESAVKAVRFFEKLKFVKAKISLKSSHVLDTVRAYRLVTKKLNYPLHLGITEAGSLFSGTVKSSVGIGILLAEGIGDTLRVSLTGHPVEEVRVGREILKALHLRELGPEIISCPTCGRCEMDIIRIVGEVERRLSTSSPSLTVAIMGCAANGPGEASKADVGIAGGRGTGVLFRKGKAVRKVKEEKLVECLIREVERLSSPS
jgi:(E)-4-hydroxy-3-methylbut-2-enyl-diphosphate synthase